MSRVIHPDAKLPKGYVCVDLETETAENATSISPHTGFKPYLMAIHGGIYGFEDQILDMDVSSPTTSSWPLSVMPFKCIIGHNLKFDLHFIRAFSPLFTVMDPDRISDIRDSEYIKDYDWISKHACVFDTQFVTYLHSGHRLKYNTLEEAAEYWGVPATKTLDLAEELPKVGWDIRKVPKLAEYAVNDVEITCRIFNKMMKDPWVIENFRWLLAMHDGYMGTFEMEYNGTHADPTRIASLMKTCEKKLDDSLKEIRDLVSPGWEFEPGSNSHVAAALYGGVITTKRREKVGVYKTGAKMGSPRYKVISEDHVMPIMHSPTKPMLTPSGSPSVADDALDAILDDGASPDCVKFIKLLKTFRAYAKLHGTYLQGLTKHITFKADTREYYVYPSINVCQTATGRTSSSKPNMQNQPTHDEVGVGEIFTSRYRDSGTILEVDFKQIEIFALAVLSKDVQLMDDLQHGRDIHAMTGLGVFGSKMSKEQRRICKIINFGLIYGGSAATLSKQAGIDTHLASQLIKAFFKRYKGVQEYFQQRYTNLNILCDSFGERDSFDEAGRMAKRYVHPSETGRRYCYKQYYSAYSKKMEVSYTESRNYPIQGLATGDLMLTVLGKVWRHLLPKYGNDVKLIGLVHDSLRFDAKSCVLDPLMLDLKYMLEKGHEFLNEAIKKPDFWTLPVKVEFSSGPDFAHMTEYTGV